MSVMPVETRHKSCGTCNYWKKVEDTDLIASLGLERNWGRCTNSSVNFKLSDSTEVDTSDLSMLLANKYVYQQKLLGSSIFYSSPAFYCNHHQDRLS